LPGYDNTIKEALKECMIEKVEELQGEGSLEGNNSFDILLENLCEKSPQTSVYEVIINKLKGETEKEKNI